MPNGIERREFYRHPVHLPLRLPEAAGPVPSSPESHDISLGGASFLSPVPVPVGHKMRLQIPLPERICEVKARIAHCEEYGETGQYRIGIAFTENSSFLRACLSRIFFQIYEYHREARRRQPDLTEETAGDQWITQNRPRFLL
jgi:c-di-GMP-binding flagellar brake protein YcgR